MDNMKIPAYPAEVRYDASQQIPNQIGDAGLYRESGFTKLELASLMIARGLCADPNFSGSREMIAAVSVSQAKAVLEEANK